ncbi:uncharacterized protein ARMOST_08295 [Armillaria ostoyae]|uniref:Uncharacterized protein n=1 Tax=Armillaria ostoyae TaxID=47428 RepID=A0A284R894_ARMOS|nr:uncharacterized protein ARMOST_08295 [Armillaria ostoyae]
MLGGGGLLGKEILREKHRTVGDVEEEGRTKIGTPTAHNDGDGYALLGIDGGVDGAANAPTIIVMRQFSRPLLPAPPKSNVGLPRTPATPETRIPHYLVGGTRLYRVTVPPMPPMLGVANPIHMPAPSTP